MIIASLVLTMGLNPIVDNLYMEQDFTNKLKSDSPTIVSLEIEWDSGDEMAAIAEPPPPPPEPEPEPVVETASRSGGRAEMVSTPVHTVPPARMGSVVETAMQYLGYPYVWGTAGPNTFDCSGFTSYIYGLHGISLSRSSSAQWGAGTPIPRSEIQPGDLMVKSGHVAIYIGNNQIIHASTPSTGVIISPLSWYDNQHIEFRRF